MGLTEISAAGAIMIAFVILTRKIMGNRLPKVTFLVLWWCVILRLLLPFGIPSSCSVVSIAENGGSYLRTAIADIAERNVSELNITESYVERLSIDEPLAAESDNSDQGVVVETADTYSVSSTALEVPATLKEYAYYLYLAGTAIFAAFFLIGYLRGLRAFAVAIPVKEEVVTEWADGHPLRRKYVVKKLRGLSGPITYGIRKPVILLPEVLCEGLATGSISKEELSYILLHEYIHICRWDALTKIFLAAAVCLHWWNPMVWWMYVLANRDIELSCDEAVLWKLGEDKKAAYANLLIAMETWKSGFTPFYSGFGTEKTEERIYAVMKNKKYTVAAVAAVAILVLGTVIVFSFSERADSKASPEATFVESAEGSEEEASINAEKEYEQLSKEYAALGVTEDEKGNLYYNGELVRFFLDGYEQKGEGGGENQISRYTYYNDKGTVDVHTVYDDLRQKDGSTELFGKLIDIVPYSEEEFAARSEEWQESQKTLYEGEENIAYEASYNTYSGDKTPEATTSVAEAVLIESADVELSETEYDNGRSVSEFTVEAVETNVEATGETSVGGVTEAVESEENTADTGRSHADIFAQYAKWGITYEENDGKRNVYLNGELVGLFVDVDKNNQRTFTFESSDGGDLVVGTIYDKNGRLYGVKEISE